MKVSGFERAVEAMLYMEKGRPYSLHPDDKKRKLLDELARLCREIGGSPVVIGGLAVSHHGYVRTTVDVDVLMTEEEGMRLIRHLKEQLGWKRHAEGFKNTELGVGLDICIGGRPTSPRWRETFPEPDALRKVAVRPLPVVSLPELIALKAMSGRLQDDADIGGLIKVHPARLASLHAFASKKLQSAESRAHFEALIARVREELSGRR